MRGSLVISSREISGLVQRTLNQVDTRLVDHGKRVAFLVAGMLDEQPEFTEKEKSEIIFLSMMHDIGAYKTEEINRMIQFEVDDVWEHSVYGYLFILHLSPLKEWAAAILYHHVPYKELPHMDERVGKISQMLHLADRIEILCRQGRKAADIIKYVKAAPANYFQDEIVNLFLEKEQEHQLLEQMLDQNAVEAALKNDMFSESEIESFLKLVIYAIDFRSQHTVTHTITTTSIACCIAELMKMSDREIHQIYYGALLHDLGKIGIPVEILEFPGKLSPQAMSIMRTHVNITGQILGDKINPAVAKIALRHHEKLDGTGYPLGLTASDMTLEEQIVAVSDITSALLGTRSYKDAFSKDKTLGILEKEKNMQKLNAEVIDILHDNFEYVLDYVEDKCSPVLETYLGLRKEYMKLISDHLFKNTSVISAP